MIPSTQNQVNPATFSISPCLSNKERKLFEKIPELLHSENTAFTPPFPGSVVKLIEPKGTFCQQHGQIVPLIAFQHGKPVGRIAAIINRSHNNYNKDTVGFFGFFDCINDHQVSSLLFDEAAKILRNHGMTILRGPYNPSINDDCGLLTQGCEQPAFVSMPWNPSYYANLYADAGLQTVRTLYAWMVPMDKETPERVNKIVRRIQQRLKVTIRSINMKNLKDDLTIIHRLYNRTLDRNWGFYPISLEDLLHAADDLKAIADPSLILFACADGKEIAFSLSLPNVNELFYAARKRKGILRFLEIVLRMQFQKITAARLCVLGVDPEYRDKGLSALLFYEAYIRTKRKYQRSEVSWVEANNVEILEGAELMGGYRDKTYEIFEKNL